MTADKKTNFQTDKDIIRSNLLFYTRYAFNMLPGLNKPHILDIGCGSGVPTIELANLCDGDLIALDNDQSLLDLLKTKLVDRNLQNRVKIVKGSLLDLDFAPSSFDIIWAEGSISFIGFEKGLNEWRPFLKTNGFLVVHDDKKNIESKLDLIGKSNYNLRTYFILTKDVWWNEYYAPLERKLQELKDRYSGDPDLLLDLEKEQREIDSYRKNPQLFESVFFILQKIE